MSVFSNRQLIERSTEVLDKDGVVCSRLEDRVPVFGADRNWLSRQLPKEARGCTLRTTLIFTDVHATQRVAEEYFQDNRRVFVRVAQVKLEELPSEDEGTGMMTDQRGPAMTRDP